MIVYRLITANSVEEKIYMRQVYKSSINNAAIESSFNTSNTVKYFNDAELTKLIDFNPDLKECHAFSIIRNGFSFSEGQKFENGMVNRPLNIESTPTNSQHQAFLESLGIVGLTNHSDLFKEGEPENSE